MKWLTNTRDPRRADRSAYAQKWPGETPQEALDRLDAWLADKIIGEPKATPGYTVAELKAMHLVGVYQEDSQ